MIRINQLKVPCPHNERDLLAAAASRLHIPQESIHSYTIRRLSLDARKKPLIYEVYSLDISVSHEERILKRLHNHDIQKAFDTEYLFPEAGESKLAERPVIVGAGPAGLFCAYMLAKYGYRPLVIEQGAPMQDRIADVRKFWSTGVLDPYSNVQFGEGGAGTFSDGKLNTLVNDRFGRSRKILEIFVSCGAPKDILYRSDPHIGTDQLSTVIRTLRGKIEAMGGEFRFRTCLTGIDTRNGVIRSVTVNDHESLPSGVLVIACGHSARNTFSLLYTQKAAMSAKSFAVGMRVEHSQKLINTIRYGREEPEDLWPAEYKAAAKTREGRSIYTFCMCPGGYVVNASSEPGRLACNGMSYRARNGQNANSAVITSVVPEDFLPYGSPDTPDVFKGIAFQRFLEEQAYKACGGKIPVQLLGDFRKNRTSSTFGSIYPCMRGAFSFGDVRGIYPGYIAQSFLQGMEIFDRGMPGFNEDDVIVSGVESRTSSPVRILRGEDFQSSIRGLYPCGEGAGYAGGIMSAAMDGLKTAEAIRRRYFF